MRLQKDCDEPSREYIGGTQLFLAHAVQDKDRADAARNQLFRAMYVLLNVEIYYQSRIGSPTRRALAPEADGKPFTFWFSTNSEDLPSGSKEHANFSKTEKLVERLVEKSNGLLKAEFVQRDYRTLTL